MGTLIIDALTSHAGWTSILVAIMNVKHEAVSQQPTLVVLHTYFHVASQRKSCALVRTANVQGNMLLEHAADLVSRKTHENVSHGDVAQRLH
jgi:hypothetical protein